MLAAWQPSSSVGTETSHSILGVLTAVCVHSGLCFLSGNSPHRLPVVVRKGWQWFGMKFYVMRCGGMNADIIPLLLSSLSLLISVHLTRSEIH